MVRLVRVMRAAGVKFGREGGSFLAQAIAFNALFAIFPLALLSIAILGFAYGSTQGELRAIELISTVAPGLQAIIADNLENVIAFRNISGIVGLVAVIWSGKNLFMALAYALDRALDVPKHRTLWHDTVIALVMLPVAGVLLLLATLVPVVISIVLHFGILSDLLRYSQIASYGSAVAIVFTLLVILYTFLPNRTVSWRFSIPGALFASIAWEITQIAFAVYTTHTNLLHVYGAVSAILAVLLWFYLTGVIFLFGAHVSAAWENDRIVRSGAISIAKDRTLSG